MPAAPSFSHPELSSRHPELVSGSNSRHAGQRHPELDSGPDPASRHPKLDSGSRPTRKKFSLQAIFTAGADHDGYPFVPSASRPGSTLPGIIDTLFQDIDSRHAELVSASPVRHCGLDPQSSRHAELDSASPSRHPGLAPASLAAYIKFALWHTSVEYESPHRKKLEALIENCPIFRADFKPSMDFSKTLMDYGDNIPIWSRLGYSYKEYYLKFGQPDLSTLKPPSDYELFGASSFRRKKPKK